MKTAPKELLNTLRLLSFHTTDPNTALGLDRLTDEYAPERTNHTVVAPPANHVQILMHDRDEWKARALKAEKQVDELRHFDSYKSRAEHAERQLDALRDSLLVLKNFIIEE